MSLVSSTSRRPTWLNLFPPTVSLPALAPACQRSASGPLSSDGMASPMSASSRGIPTWVALGLPTSIRVGATAAKRREPITRRASLTSRAPGCACDIPSILYSFSFAPNPSWSQTLAPAHEIWQYLNRVAQEYDLTRKVSFRSEVVRCEWVESTARWRMHIRDLNKGERQVHECQFLFSGTGVLTKPQPWDVPGADTFQGLLFHSAQWPADLDVTGKRVVLVGNGCSALQIVPNIVAKTRRLSQFVRSKHWILPPSSNVPNTKAWQWAARNLPGVLKFFRVAIFVRIENEVRGFFMTQASQDFRRRTEAGAIEYIKTTAPAKYHDMLIPDFALGCKRRIPDPGYCRALHAENISVSDEAIVEVVPEGVRTRDGLVTEADVIILANGFETNRNLAGIELVGRSGKTVEEHWADWGGPEAYNCCALSDFPNFFMILGPNAATGHTSAIIAAENTINYALRIIKPVLDGEARFAEVRREAEVEYSRKLQAALQKTVWQSGCKSWYFKEDETGKKWNATSYPYWQPRFWFDCFFPVYKDWEFPVRLRPSIVSFTN